MRWFFLVMWLVTLVSVNYLTLRDLKSDGLGFLLGFDVSFLGLSLLWFYGYFVGGQRRDVGMSRGMGLITAVIATFMIWSGTHLLGSARCEPAGHSRRAFGLFMDYLQAHGNCNLAGVLYILIGLFIGAIACKMLLRKISPNTLW